MAQGSFFETMQSNTTSMGASEPKVQFVLEEVSKRHVKKYNANSCVFHAHIENDNLLSMNCPNCLTM